MSEYMPENATQGSSYTTILETTDYLEGQRAVDRLSDEGFPVDGVKIVGHDMKSVEIVTGRMTTGKAAGVGALGGLWVGLFVGRRVVIFGVGGVVTIRRAA